MSAFNWIEYLQLARHLEKNQPSGLSAAALRSVVSRAYYSAFHHAEKWIYGQGHPPYPRHGKHAAVIRDLKNKYYKNDASDQLKSLRILREQCDYDDNVFSLQKDAISSIHTSEFIINLLQ